eukprot:jgi/Mesvir1/21350/Mv20840-RA.1
MGKLPGKLAIAKVVTGKVASAKIASIAKKIGGSSESKSGTPKAGTPRAAGTVADVHVSTLGKDEILNYFLPDAQEIGAACGMIGPAFMEAIETFFNATKRKKTGQQDWTVPLFGCHEDIGLCILTCLCGPCVVAPRNMAQVSKKGCPGHLFSLIATALFGLVCCYTASERGRIREAYDIQGSPQQDCLVSCCFCPCTTCQHAYEIRQHDSSYIVPFSGVLSVKITPPKSSTSKTSPPKTQAMSTEV